MRRLEYKVVLQINMLYAISTFIHAYLTNYKGYDANSLFMGTSYTIYWGIYSTLFPFIIVLPFATTYIDDINEKTYYTYINRMGKGSYILKKILNTFMGNFIVFGIPFMANLLMCNIFIGHTRKSPLGMYDSRNFIMAMTGENQLYSSFTPNMPFISVFKFSPMLYNVIFVIMLSFVAGIMGCAILAFSFWFSNYKLLLFLPFFLISKVGKVLTTYSFSKAMRNQNVKFVNFNLVDYISPFSFGGKVYLGFIVGVGLLIAFVAISGIIFSQKEIVNV